MGPSSWSSPSLFGAVSARLALLRGSLGPLSALSSRPVAHLRLPWDPFGAFGVHLLSLFGVSFWGSVFASILNPNMELTLMVWGGCLMCAKCGK